MTDTHLVRFNPAQAYAGSLDQEAYYGGHRGEHPDLLGPENEHAQVNYGRKKVNKCCYT